MTGVAIIPARGGSSRIPRKNVIEFRGRPMLHYPIEAARQSGLFSQIYVSTEDKSIKTIAINCGARVISRPPHLAQNEVGTQKVMQHAVKALHLRPQTEVCCIYPCTPLLTPNDLRRAHALLNSGKPSTAYVIAVADAPDLKDTGWFYYGSAQFFERDAPLNAEGTRLYRVDAMRAIDINVQEDLRRAEEIYDVIHKRAA